LGIDFSRQHTASLCVLVEMTQSSGCFWGEENRARSARFSSPLCLRWSCHFDAARAARNLLKYKRLQKHVIDTAGRNLPRYKHLQKLVIGKERSPAHAESQSIGEVLKGDLPRWPASPELQRGGQGENLFTVIAIIYIHKNGSRNKYAF